MVDKHRLLGLLDEVKEKITDQEYIDLVNCLIPEEIPIDTFRDAKLVKLIYRENTYPQVDLIDYYIHKDEDDDYPYPARSWPFRAELVQSDMKSAIFKITDHPQSQNCPHHVETLGDVLTNSSSVMSRKMLMFLISNIRFHHKLQNDCEDDLDILFKEQRPKQENFIIDKNAWVNPIRMDVLA